MRPGKIIVTFLVLVHGYAFGGVKEDIAKTIVRVRSGLKYSTGFFWKDGTTIVTTLHSISDKSDIEVYLPTISGWKKVTPVRVSKSADLVLLRVADFVSTEFISSRYNAKPQTDTKVFTIGYNAGNVAYQDRDFEVGLIQGNTLKDLLPESAEKEIRDIGFPALTTEII